MSKDSKKAEEACTTVIHVSQADFSCFNSLSIEILRYECDRSCGKPSHVGKWACKATIKVRNVEKPSKMSNPTILKRFKYRPTKFQIIQTAAELFTHELEEQLGLNPHNLKTPPRPRIVFRQVEPSIEIEDHYSFIATERHRK